MNSYIIYCRQTISSLKKNGKIAKNQLKYKMNIKDTFKSMNKDKEKKKKNSHILHILQFIKKKNLNLIEIKIKIY